MIKILKDEIKKNKIFTGLAYALCIIMFTGFVFNNVFLNALGVLVAACFLISPIHIIPALFCASLFDESLFAFGFTYSRILTLIFLLGALYRIIVDKRKIYLKAVVVCACISVSYTHLDVYKRQVYSPPHSLFS